VRTCDTAVYVLAGYDEVRVTCEREYISNGSNTHPYILCADCVAALVRRSQRLDFLRWAYREQRNQARIALEDERDLNALSWRGFP
jgi:hypothetical protein